MQVGCPSHKETRSRSGTEVDEVEELSVPDRTCHKLSFHQLDLEWGGNKVVEQLPQVSSFLMTYCRF